MIAHSTAHYNPNYHVLVPACIVSNIVSYYSLHPIHSLISSHIFHFCIKIITLPFSLYLRFVDMTISSSSQCIPSPFHLNYNLILVQLTNISFVSFKKNYSCLYVPTFFIPTEGLSSLLYPVLWCLTSS